MKKNKAWKKLQEVDAALGDYTKVLQLASFANLPTNLLQKEVYHIDENQANTS